MYKDVAIYDADMKNEALANYKSYIRVGLGETYLQRLQS